MKKMQRCPEMVCDSQAMLQGTLGALGKVSGNRNIVNANRRTRLNSYYGTFLRWHLSFPSVWEHPIS